MMRWSVVLLKDKSIVYNMLDHWQHLLREYDIAVILATDSHSRSTQINSVIPIFDTALETITDLEKVDCMHSKRRGAMSLQ